MKKSILAVCVVALVAIVSVAAAIGQTQSEDAVKYPSEEEIEEALRAARGTFFGANVVGLGTVNCGPTNIPNVVECAFVGDLRQQKEEFVFNGGRWSLMN